MEQCACMTNSLAAFKACIGSAPVYVGLGVHGGHIDVALCSLEPEGAFTGEVHGDGKELIRKLLGMGLNIAMVTYEDSQSCCLFWQLRAAGLPVQVVTGERAQLYGVGSDGNSALDAMVLARKSAEGLLPEECVLTVPTGREKYADAAKEMLADLENGEAELFGILMEDLDSWKLPVPEHMARQWCEELQAWTDALTLPTSRRNLVDRSMRALKWHHEQREHWQQCYRRLLGLPEQEYSHG